MGDPRGCEALTQQEAEQDALRERAEKEPLDVDISDYSDEFCAGFLKGQANALDALERAQNTLGALDSARAALAVAVRERDQARDALRQIESSLRPHRAASGEWAVDAVMIAEVSVIVRAALAGGETVNQKPKGHTA